MLDTGRALHRGGLPAALTLLRHLSHPATNSHDQKGKGDMCVRREGNDSNIQAFNWIVLTDFTVSVQNRNEKYFNDESQMKHHKAK